jgi:SnoaL-like protein
LRNSLRAGRIARGRRMGESASATRTEALMNTKELSKKLVQLCKEDKNLESINTLYSPDIVSVEAFAPPGQDRTMKGLDAVRGKHDWWTENHIIHKAEVFGPYPHGDDRFAVRFVYDITFKPTKQRRTMDEVGVYTVKDGKVVREEYFYQGGD